MGAVYKPRRQVGEGVAQMSTLLNKSYLVKVSTEREGVPEKNHIGLQKNVQYCKFS